MKIKANDYEPKDVLKIMREWSQLSQEEFSQTVDLSTWSIQSYEVGRRRCLFDTFLKIANKHGITITLEKK